MFGFSKHKKEVDSSKIKSYKDALEAIHIFMLLSEWQKARHALEEIKLKEKKSFDELLEKINQDDSVFAEKQRLEIIWDYKQKEIHLAKIEQKLNKAEDEHKDKKQREQFKIRFKNIKAEIHNLVWNSRSDEAMDLLQRFLEENKDNYRVIKFFNLEKKSLQKHIEKQRNIEEKKFKDNAKMQAMKLIWASVNLESQEEKKLKEEKMSFMELLKSRLNFYKNLKEKVRKKRLLDEINLLIEEDSKVKHDIAEKKLASIHKWLIKELTFAKMLWYDIYGKILWSDKISGDTFDIHEAKDKYTFFLGDATGHWIRAGFIVTLLSRLFHKHVLSPLQTLTFEINNGLKQDLKNRNFITWIFFETKKDTPEEIQFVWMWHEPILIYRHESKSIEKVIPWGLAAGIRLIDKKENIKVKTLQVSPDDIILTYSDWILEHKNSQWEFYGLPRLIQSFEKITKAEKNIHKIYEYLINDVQLFQWGSHFNDDVSVLLLRRNTQKDILNENSEFLEQVSVKEWLTKKQVKKLAWKTIPEVEKELEKIQKDKDTQRIIKVLENLYYTGEILKLKQEAIRYIKQWYIHQKINHYLRKAIDNEMKYKVEQKNQKMSSKYAVLNELYKKWDYQTVINEVEEIISKDGNI